MHWKCIWKAMHGRLPRLPQESQESVRWLGCILSSLVAPTCLAQLSYRRQQRLRKCRRSTSPGYCGKWRCWILAAACCAHKSSSPIIGVQKLQWVGIHSRTNDMNPHPKTPGWHKERAHDTKSKRHNCHCTCHQRIAKLYLTNIPSRRAYCNFWFSSFKTSPFSSKIRTYH